MPRRKSVQSEMLADVGILTEWMYWSPNRSNCDEENRSISSGRVAGSWNLMTNVRDEVPKAPMMMFEGVESLPGV